VTLNPQILRRRPQLATVQVLTSELETTLVALCAAHALIELDLKTRTEAVLPVDHLADRAAEQAIQLLDALDLSTATEVPSTTSSTRGTRGRRRPRRTSSSACSVETVVDAAPRYDRFRRTRSRMCTPLRSPRAARVNETATTVVSHLFRS
jgi:hypothetical protein